MLAAAPAEDEQRQRYLNELDNELGVAGWGTPGQVAIKYDRDPAAPSWWYGDEEASQSFIRAVGVNLDG